MEVILPLSKAIITSYFLHFSTLGVLILLSLQFASTFLYSKGNLQYSSEVVINNLPSNFNQKQPIARLFFSSNNIYYVFVSATKLNLRSGPGLKNSVLRIIPRGTHMLSLSSQNSDWLRVFAPHNFDGWVSRKHVIFYLPNPVNSL